MKKIPVVGQMNERFPAKEPVNLPILFFGDFELCDA